MVVPDWSVFCRVDCSMVIFWEYLGVSASTERAQCHSSNQHRPLRSTTLAVRSAENWIKLCVLVYKCLHQAAPTYLAELCLPVSESANRAHLCSATRCDLAIPCFRTTTYGQRCFAVSGPTLWNLLPLFVHDPSRTVTQFCARLKTVLFCRACETLA